MATIKEDIQAGAAWIVEYFNSERILLDYSIDSFRSIDIFFDHYSDKIKSSEEEENPERTKQILFSLGTYVGETIIRNFSGSSWLINENDRGNYLDLSIKLPNGKLITPMQRVAARFNGSNRDAIYAYGAAILKELTRENYWDTIKNNLQYSKSKISGKQRWRFG